jgi:D-tyrosyl-tRNA(Tyr) deacylase
MRAVIQRVSQARVEVNGQQISQIDKGLLVYVSFARKDTDKDANFIAEKLINLRIFADHAGRMNLSILDVASSILLVSNFTLHGDCRKGRRPGFDAAAESVPAQRLYERLIEFITTQGVNVQEGGFGEHMLVTSVNDGPVTFLLDSTRLF